MTERTTRIIKKADRFKLVGMAAMAFGGLSLVISMVNGLAETVFLGLPPTLALLVFGGGILALWEGCKTNTPQDELLRRFIFGSRSSPEDPN